VKGTIVIVARGLGSPTQEPGWQQALSDSYVLKSLPLRILTYQTWCSIQPLINPSLLNEFREEDTRLLNAWYPWIRSLRLAGGNI
jgi:hypothetical protein